MMSMINAFKTLSRDNKLLSIPVRAEKFSRGKVVSLAKPDITAVAKGTSTSDILLVLVIAL